jgi:hypothetical protein
MKPKIGWYLAVIVLFGLQGPLDAKADITRMHPSEACNLLVDAGLPTLGWKTYYADESGCSSPTKFVGSGNPFRNGISYYVDGRGQTVRQLRLIVSVLNANESAVALAEFQNAAEMLIVKITSRPAPASISRAIKSGIDLVTKIDGVIIELTRKEWVMNTDWESRRCYEIRLVIR